MSEPNIYSVPLNYTPPVLPKFKLPPQNFGEKVVSDIIHEHKVDIEYITWIETVRQKANEVRMKVRISGPCTIVRVPESMQRTGGDDKPYDPIVATIGAYH